MASANSSTTTVPSTLSVQISEKLTKSNFILWKAQVMSAIRAAELEGFLIGAEKAPPMTLLTKDDKGNDVHQHNPAYSQWVARDQAVLGYLLSSLTRETLVTVATSTRAAEAWSELSKLYSSQTCARTVNTRIALATTKKLQLSVADYYNKMRSLADDMAFSGTPLCDDELVSYILAGLDEDYNPVYSTVTSRVEPITPSELYAQLLGFEHHLQLQNGGTSSFNSAANTASRGRGMSRGRSGSGSRGRGRGRSRGASRGGFNNNRTDTNNVARPQCQVFLKIGHTAATCWYRFDEDFIPEQRTAAAATASYGSDNNWYTDSKATDHITGELDKLTMHDAYNGTDQIHAANGAGMEISHIGTSVIPTPCRNLVLNNVLHVPSANKNLISVHKFTLDNDIFIEFHPFNFFIKDRKTKRVLLQGPCRGGLYPLPSFASKLRKLIFNVTRFSVDHWHNRLGHPARDIVVRVIRENKLPCASLDTISHSVCDPCLRAKARQLPYSVSSSRATAPLELTHSDVWGPAIQSFGRKKYYVSFIDDYSKFIWIYLLHRKSEVFQYFL
jgi:hypothetical protein